jgi:hypothetical protein
MNAMSSTNAGTDMHADIVAENIQVSTVPGNELYSLGHTPIILGKVFEYSHDYIDAKFLQNGFQFGFSLQYAGP